MKLIHCADFHLDAPLRTNLPPEAARQRRAELMQTFGRMAEYAQTEGVAAVLIAGDLFDSAAPRREVMDYVAGTIGKYPQIQFYYLRGNHDGAMHFPVVPDNLHLFSDKWQRYVCGDVTIYGAEGCRCNADYDGLTPDSSDCNMVLLHGQPSSTAGADAVPLPILRGRNIDYLALGHIHACQSGTLDTRGTWVCAGCPEGRGYDESGEKGFMLLEVFNRCVTAQFVPFASRTLHLCEVDLTGADTLIHQSDRVMDAVAAIPRKDMVDVLLVGEVVPEQTPDTAFLQQQLAGRFFMLRVSDRTRLAIDRAQYRQEISLKGVFFRLVESAPDLSPEDLDYVLRAGFSALNGDPIPM